MNKKRYEYLKDNKNMYREIARLEEKKVLENLKITRAGLNNDEVEQSFDNFGNNVVDISNEKSQFRLLVESFINPFTIVLIVLGIISYILDVLLVSIDKQDYTTVIIIFLMVTISGVLSYFQTSKSKQAAKQLKSLSDLTCSVKRAGFEFVEILMDDVVVLDVVSILAGDMIPADLRLIETKDLFVSQTSMTGEVDVVEKVSKSDNSEHGSIFDYENIVYRGTNVVSGYGIGIVIAVGKDTEFGKIASSISESNTKTGFEKGINSVSWLLIKLMLIMVPIVLLINGFSKGDWLSALLFALSIAVGLTPEMLPTIITSNLVKGSMKMSKEKTIVKNINSIQNFGAMDVLCSDKTGTLTKDRIELSYYLDIFGNTDNFVLEYAYLNSHYQTGLKSPIDDAIITKTNLDMEIDTNKYQLIDEIPFDFERRRVSVVVKNGDTKIITKGAVEEILNICEYVKYNDSIIEFNIEQRKNVLVEVNSLNKQGYRVIAVAMKQTALQEYEFNVSDESNMILIGYLAFLDQPKESAALAVNTLQDNGVKVKVLTGDNDLVAKTICDKVGVNTSKIVFGYEVDKLDDDSLKNIVDECDLFVKLSPAQKSRIIISLQDRGHIVGYLGDGINDAIALKNADIGISVDTAVDIAKESADIILMEKDLDILNTGIISGRKVFANIIKYLKITVSSNFGNVLSILVASIFLPFLPMIPIQILLLNLIYDVSCITLPWDKVDKEYTKKPRKWDSKSISSFMKWFGPISSIFDILTYIILYFIICPLVVGGNYHELDSSKQMIFMMVFNTGWFIESLYTQTLVLHLLRSNKKPFIESNASSKVIASTIFGMVLGTIIPYLSFSDELGFIKLPVQYYLFLVVIIVGYIMLSIIVKKLYLKKYGEIL